MLSRQRVIGAVGASAAYGYALLHINTWLVSCLLFRVSVAQEIIFWHLSQWQSLFSENNEYILDKRGYISFNLLPTSHFIYEIYNSLISIMSK